MPERPWDTLHPTQVLRVEGGWSVRYVDGTARHIADHEVEVQVKWGGGTDEEAATRLARAYRRMALEKEPARG